MAIIKPSDYLGNNYEEISKICHETDKPLYITKSGYSDLVVLSNELYEILTQEKIYEKEVKKIETVSEKSTSEDAYLGLTPNTLIISGLNGNIIYPYTLTELDIIFKKNPNKYSSFQQIIDEVYTKPAKIFQNSSVSRFREAYKLVRKKESKSVTEAVDLALELFTNYNLHPAIITACKSIDELDIYLACLATNELENFHIFNIVFNIPPVLAVS